MGKNYDGIFTGLPSGKILKQMAPPELKNVGYRDKYQK